MSLLNNFKRAVVSMFLVISFLLNTSVFLRGAPKVMQLTYFQIS